MDLKDYLRVIRRRWFEFIIVLSFIVVIYAYISKVEKDLYVASATLQVAASDFNENARGKQTFFRNYEDFIALLQQRGGDSVFKEIAENVKSKMILAASLPDLAPETVSNFLNQNNRRESFYAVGFQEGLKKHYRHGENIRDLRTAYDFIRASLEQEKKPVTDESIKKRIESASYRISVKKSDQSTFSNAVSLTIQTENESLSRLLVNEVAFYAMKQFNEKNKKRMKKRANKIDRWWTNSEKQDLIEQLYNGIITKYREYKTAKYRKKIDQANRIEEEYLREFSKPLGKEGILVNSFFDAFNRDRVDEIRGLQKELADVNSRYNNLRTWGLGGNAENIVANEEEVAESVRKNVERINQLQIEILELEQERELSQYRFSEVDPKKRELLIKTNARLRNIQDQIDQEEIALRDFESRYTSQHPRVVESRNNINSLKEFKQRLEEDIQSNDVAQFDFRIGEIDASIRFNRQAIVKIEEELEVKRKEMEQISDMKLHLGDIQEERKQIFNRINGLKQELADLKRQIDLDRIVDVHQFAKNVFKAPRRHTSQTFMLTFVVGIVIAIFFVYFREYIDTTIKTEHDVRRHMNLPILSMVGKAKKEVILTELPSKDPFAEHFNTAATLVRSAAQDLGLTSFLVTSTVPQEGKTTICVDLAIALARKGLRIIVVDGDLRIPTVHEVLEVDNSTGLSTILEGRTSSEDVSGVEQYLKPTSIENLRVLSSGPIPADPINLLESVRMKALAEELKEHCDYLIIDTPPIYNVGDTLTMASLVDATLFVVGAERVEQDQVTWAKHLLANVNANILGVFLNMVRVPGKSYYYYYNGYKSYRARG